MKKLTKRQGRDLRAIAPRKDEDIDFSDVPPVLDWSKAEIGKFLQSREEARNIASGF